MGGGGGGRARYNRGRDGEEEKAGRGREMQNASLCHSLSVQILSKTGTQYII